VDRRLKDTKKGSTKLVVYQHRRLTELRCTLELMVSVKKNTRNLTV
jgi:hypothetical protein